MTFTRIDIGKNEREKMCALLNQRLAETIDLAGQCKQAHWNVKGTNFIALHEMFDQFNTALLPYVDDVAERITALGGTAHGTAQSVVKASELGKYPENIVAGEDHLKALGDAFAKFAKATREGISEADDAGDKDTADLLTGLSRLADKNLWFIDAHLEKKA